MYSYRPVLLLLLVMGKTAVSCQPPPPTMFSHNSAVNSFDQQSNIASSPQGNEIAQDVYGVFVDEPNNVLQPLRWPNSIDSPVGTTLDNNLAFTPYPGYIPPPPPSPPPPPPLSVQNAAKKSPSLDGAMLFSPPQGLDNSIVSPSHYEEQHSCPMGLRLPFDFHSCVRRIAFVPTSETSTTCSFEDGTYCRFQPTSPFTQMGTLSSPAYYAALAKLSGRSAKSQPENNFVYAFTAQETSDGEQLILSAPIMCQSGNGLLKFDYWVIGDRSATIKVCTQDPEIRSCTKPIIYTESPGVTVEVIHPKASMFEIDIVAMNMTQTTIVVLDNINYNAEFCENSQETDDKTNSKQALDEIIREFFEEGADSTSEKVNQKKVYHSDFVAKQVQRHNTLSTACRLLPCSFSNNTCGYQNYVNQSMSLLEWKLGNQRIENVHSGIKIKDDSDGGFLFVGTNTSNLGVSTYILESPRFTLSRNMELSFDVYRRSKDISLEVCFDSPFNCPYSVSAFDKNVHWKQGENLTIPKKTTKIFFKAVQWRKFKWLAIDNIRLSPCPLVHNLHRKSQ